MSVSAATLRLLIDAGLEGDALVAVVASMEADMTADAPPRSSGAVRQARYRTNKKSKNVTSDVTRYVTGDASPPPDKERSPTPPKEINPHDSEAKASGAVAPPTEFEEDDRTKLFGPGRQWLEKQTGQSTKQVRTLLGRWLKLVGDDATAVLAIVRRAKDLNIAEPIAWIEAALRGSAAPVAHRDDGVTDRHGHRIDWDARASFFAKSGMWLDEWGDPKRSIPPEHRSKFSKLMEAA